ncbi:glycosyltransferase [Methanogenium sp. S4BF]|uniref:glycosyltransferase n=1 Tax=Methanogenium sp. S4BF TaxID=1789226 RepID=UPI00241753B1|nr:glycosyltransferase [Methanogenium sp. S4BF]WFN34366.1 glycosyltransferase [Methanogenium sp. S4BF]
MLIILGCIFLAVSAFPYIIYGFGIMFGKKGVLPPKLSKLPHISIIISAYNESNVIQRRVDNIASSSYPKERYEVIFIDDCSDDNTFLITETALADANMSFKILRNEDRRGTNRSYNRGMKIASHDIIVTTDADVFFEKNALKNLVSRLVSDDAIAAVCSDMFPLLSSEIRRTGKYEQNYRSVYGRMCGWESAHDSTYNFNGGLVAFKREIFSEIREGKGADDANTAFEAIRRGFRAYYETSAIVFEEIPENLKDQSRQKIRRATRLIEATLGNLDVLKISRPFSRIFFPLRIMMVTISPFLFFLGIGIMIVGFLLSSFPIICFGIGAFVILVVLGFSRFAQSFVVNQYYLLRGLLRLGSDVSVWESTSKKGDNI